MEGARPMEPDTYCRAETRKGSPCEKTAGWGTEHPGVGRCRLHGGATPGAQVSGVVELARREAVVMGRPLSVEPHEAILECIRITAGEIQYCSDQIATLEDAMVATMFGPQIHTWITVRQRAMDRLVMYAATALKAGVEERLVTAAERYAEDIAEMMRRLAAALGHDPTDPKVKEAMRGTLTLVAGGRTAA